MRSLIRRQPQHGVAAVELAILIAVLLPLLVTPIFIGKYFWHYTVVHKAAHDAARYLSTISEKEMRTRDLAEAAGAIAHGIALEEVADLNPGYEEPIVQVFCGPSQLCTGINSSNPLPATVLVRVEVTMFDTLFGSVNTGWDGFGISSVAEVRYVGH